MTRILTITLSALVLAGCQDGYDKSAMPNATAAQHQALEGCKARQAAKDIKTYSEMATCGLAAERAFYVAIKLERMDRFEAYAANYQTLAAARDANSIPDRQASLRANKILREFYAGCRCKKPDFGPLNLGLDVETQNGYGMSPPPPPPPPSQP
jgi:hypothetical protein